MTRPEYYKFSLGTIVVTRGLAETIEAAGETLGAVCLPLLGRHVSGDWGEVCGEDAQANEDALKQDLRLVSAYTIKLAGESHKIWIITEWDRSATTILLPEDY